MKKFIENVYSEFIYNIKISRDASYLFDAETLKSKKIAVELDEKYKRFIEVYIIDNQDKSLLYILDILKENIYYIFTPFDFEPNIINSLVNKIKDIFKKSVIDDDLENINAFLDTKIYEFPVYETLDYLADNFIKDIDEDILSQKERDLPVYFSKTTRIYTAKEYLKNNFLTDYILDKKVKILVYAYLVFKEQNNIKDLYSYLQKSVDSLMLEIRRYFISLYEDFEEEINMIINPHKHIDYWCELLIKSLPDTYRKSAKVCLVDGRSLIQKDYVEDLLNAIKKKVKNFSLTYSCIDKLEYKNHALYEKAKLIESIKKPGFVEGLKGLVEIVQLNHTYSKECKILVYKNELTFMSWQYHQVSLEVLNENLVDLKSDEIRPGQLVLHYCFFGLIISPKKIFCNQDIVNLQEGDQIIVDYSYSSNLIYCRQCLINEYNYYVYKKLKKGKKR